MIDRAGTTNTLHRQPTRDLGTFLVQRGWITLDQLRQANANRKLLGGALDTCLLETGAMNEEQVLDAISQLHNVPAAGGADLRRIDEEVVALLVAEIAISARAVPFRLVGGELWVAIGDIDDLAQQDRIAFATGRRLRIHVATETRLADALSRHYGAPISDRLTHLLDRIDRPRRRWGEEEHARLLERQTGRRSSAPEPTPTPEPTPVPTPTPELAPEPTPTPAQEAEAPQTDPKVIALTTDERFRLARGKAPSVNQLRDLLASEPDRQQIATALLAYFGDRFERALLLKVEPARVSGWMGSGSGVDAKAVSAFTAPFGEPSVFLNLRQGAGFHLGPLAPMPPHQRLARCWDGALPSEALVLPVRVRDRPVVMIYADNGSQGLSKIELGVLQQVAAMAGDAFERYLRRRKVAKT